MKMTLFSVLSAALAVQGRALATGIQGCAAPDWDVEDISVAYGGGPDALRHVRFKVEGKDFVCQVAPGGKCETTIDRLMVRASLVPSGLQVAVNETYYCLDTPGFPERAV